MYCVCLLMFVIGKHNATIVRYLCDISSYNKKDHLLFMYIYIYMYMYSLDIYTCAQLVTA